MTHFATFLCQKQCRFALAMMALATAGSAVAAPRATDNISPGMGTLGEWLNTLQFWLFGL